MTERSNADGYWDEFCDWLGDNGYADPRLDAGADEWEPWLECWNAALDAREQFEKEISHHGKAN